MSRVPITLSCGCVTYFSASVPKPQAGSEMTCIICKKDVTVRYVPTGQWYWTCKTPKCRGGRNHGLSSLLAMYGGSRHNRDHPEHRVHVVDPEGSVKWQIGRHAGQGVLAFEEITIADMPPDQQQRSDSIPF